MKTEPLITNIDVPTAATETEVAIPAGCVQFCLQARGTSKLKVSYISGESGSVYRTVWPGTPLVESRLFVTGLSLFVQASKDNETLEFTTWTN